MLRKTIPLMGQSARALLRLQTEGEATACVLAPPLARGALYLVGPQGQARAFPLSPAGAGSLRLPFEPQAALVYDWDGFPLMGGFAGRAALLEKAMLSVRLLAAAAPPAPEPGPEPPPAPGPAPQPEAQPAPEPPEQTEAPAGAQPPPFQAPQNPSEALLGILQKAQELFNPPPGATPTQPPADAPAPASIPNPFARAFPQSRWQRVEYPGAAGHYLTGEGAGRNGRYTVYALPGEYAPVPRQRGFDRFLRAPDGQGYWVRVVRR